MNEARAKAEHLLRCAAVERIAPALQDLQVLLVKGMALAFEHYPKPWHRPMGDVDLLLPAAELHEAIARLERMGCPPDPVPADRPLSYASFAERLLCVRLGGASVAIELHTTLDKIVARPQDIRAIYHRGHHHPELPLCSPSRVDHLLLVVQHLANSDFDHPPGWADLRMLLDRPLDVAELCARAADWRLQTPLYAACAELRRLGSDRADPILAKLSPTPRARAAARFAASHPTRAGGLSWIARQTLLRDDTAAWLAGVARYARDRLHERHARVRTESGRESVR